MNESAIEARNLIRLSVVEGAISGTYESLRTTCSQSSCSSSASPPPARGLDSPFPRADLTEPDGLLGRQVDDDEPVRAGLLGVLDRALLAVSEQRVEVACLNDDILYGQCLQNLEAERGDKTEGGLAHEDDGGLEPLRARLAHKVKAAVVVDSLLQRDLYTWSAAYQRSAQLVLGGRVRCRSGPPG